MNELIKVEGRNIGDGLVQTINARDLYQFLEVATRFNDWITSRIDQYGFQLNQDFVTFTENTVKGRPTIEYAMTLDMGKELAMVERNEKGKQARLYFIECEKRAKSVASLPDFTDPAISARAWADQYEARKAAEVQLKAAKPAIDFVERYVEARTSQCITDVAKIIGWKPRAFTKRLEQDGVIFMRGVWLPYQEHINAGRFEVKTGENDGFGFRQTRVTPKGITWLAEKYGKDDMPEVSGAALKKAKPTGASKHN